MHEVLKEEFKSILESIGIIEQRFLKISSADDLVSSPAGVTLLDSIAMRLQTIGETVKQISKRDTELLNRYPQVDWSEIMKTRDLISHHYDEIDHEIVYVICKDHLPVLKSTVLEILKEF